MALWLSTVKWQLFWWRDIHRMRSYSEPQRLQEARLGDTMLPEDLQDAWQDVNSEGFIVHPWNWDDVKIDRHFVQPAYNHQPAIGLQRFSGRVGWAAKWFLAPLGLLGRLQGHEAKCWLQSCIPSTRLWFESRPTWPRSRGCGLTRNGWKNVLKLTSVKKHEETTF